MAKFPPYFAFSRLRPPLRRLPWLWKLRTAPIPDRRESWQASRQPCSPARPTASPLLPYVTRGRAVHTHLSALLSVCRQVETVPPKFKQTKNWSQQLVISSQKADQWCAGGLGPSFTMPARRRTIWSSCSAAAEAHQMDVDAYAFLGLSRHPQPLRCYAGGGPWGDAHTHC